MGPEGEGDPIDWGSPMDREGEGDTIDWVSP